MSPISVRTRLTMFLVAMFISTSVGAVLALVDTRPETEKAAEWVKSAHGGRVLVKWWKSVLERVTSEPASESFSYAA